MKSGFRKKDLLKIQLAEKVGSFMASIPVMVPKLRKKRWSKKSDNLRATAPHSQTAFISDFVIAYLTY